MFNFFFKNTSFLNDFFLLFSISSDEIHMRPDIQNGIKMLPAIPDVFPALNQSFNNQTNFIRWYVKVISTQRPHLNLQEIFPFAALPPVSNIS